MRFSQEGYVLEYDGTRALNGLSFTDTSYTHRTLTDSVDQYIQAFMSALVPGAEWASAGATADVRAGEMCIRDRGDAMQRVKPKMSRRKAFLVLFLILAGVGLLVWGGISLFSVRVVTNVTASLLPCPYSDTIMPFGQNVLYLSLIHICMWRLADHRPP